MSITGGTTRRILGGVNRIINSIEIRNFHVSLYAIHPSVRKPLQELERRPTRSFGGRLCAEVADKERVVLHGKHWPAANRIAYVSP